MQLEAKEKLLVAKASRNGEQWLPLHIHLSDTLGVMLHLLEEYVSGSFHVVCGLSRDELEKTALFLACSHDIGKATAVFQSKIIQSVPECGQRLLKYGLEIPSIKVFSDYLKTPHALAGENILLSYHCPKEIAAIVGAHHGVPAENGELNEQSFLLEAYPAYWINYFVSRKEESMWRRIWQHYLDFAIQKSGFHSFDEMPTLNRQAQVLLTGLLIMADWIASNTEWFPLLEEEQEDERGEKARIEEGWEAFQLTDVWYPSNEIYSETLFKQIFHFSPRELQSDVLKIISSVKKPGIYIVEAPMGCGKTEIALTASELLAAKFEKTGMFFGLPTQATANGIFPRIVKWAEKQSNGAYQSIQLTHGSSMLNKAFMDIDRGIPDVYDGDADGGVVVHSWFSGKKQSCLADFVVGTVDQFLMAALKRKHVMLLHLGLSQKVVIIDEVHAYDAYMNCYLERALSWMGMYHVPVILLSATLPAERRNALIKAYLNEKKLNADVVHTQAYPLLTWTDGQDIFQRELVYQGIHRQIQIEMDSEEKILMEMEEVLNAGGCVGIILNTVKRVQNFVDIIRKNYTENVFLYHAQYIFPDRMSKEEELLRLVGKDSVEEERKGLVVVGSQVLEQSLDLDFDLLITDLCPIDLLLQRVGRLHRHEKHDSIRPEIAKKARCLVLGADTSEFEEGSKLIYGEWLLSKTRDVLAEKANITIPDDISPLIQEVYGNFEPAENEKSFYEDFCWKKKNKENKARKFLLDKAKLKGDIHGFLKARISDAKAEASVRDGISSVEVLVMVKDREDKISFLPWQNDGVAISDADIMNSSVCKKIAEQKLRLPSVLCQTYNVDQTIEDIEGQSLNYIEKWQWSHWLKGELVLFLNENLECIVNGFLLRYNREIGLSYEKMSEKER